MEETKPRIETAKSPPALSEVWAVFHGSVPFYGAECIDIYGKKSSQGLDDLSIQVTLS